MATEERERTVNELMLDALILRQIHLLRFGAGLTTRLIALLNSSEEDIGILIRGMLKEAPTGVVNQQAWQTITTLADRISALRLQAWTAARDDALLQLDDLAEQHVQFLGDAYSSSIPVEYAFAIPVGFMLKSAIRAKPMQGITIAQWFDKMAADDDRRIRSSLYAGASAKESPERIVKRVLGTGAIRGLDGAVQAARRDVATIATTGVLHVAGEAHSAFNTANLKVLLVMDQFTAVLDGHTTKLCRSLNGHRYLRGEGPYPPLHMRCRSIRFGLLDGKVLSRWPVKPHYRDQWARIFGKDRNRPDITGDAAVPQALREAYDKWASARVRKMVGSFPEREVYQSWLKAQPATVQDDILGKAKARLFRKGGLDLEKFIDLNGREYTLAELAKVAPMAFRKAGLDPKDF